MKRLLQLVLLLTLFVSGTLQAQTFNYGTGSVAGNTAPFQTGSGAVTVSGNDVTVTANVTMQPGTYNFNNFTINSGVIVTVQAVASGTVGPSSTQGGGNVPLIIRCTGTFTNDGTLRANGTNGANASASGSGGLPGNAGWGCAGGRNGGIGGASSPSSSYPTAFQYSTSSPAGVYTNGGHGVSFDFIPNPSVSCNGSTNFPNIGGAGKRMNQNTNAGTYPTWAGAGGSGGSYGTAGTQGANGVGVSSGASVAGPAGIVYGNATLTAPTCTNLSAFNPQGQTPAGNRWILGGSGGGGGGGTQSIGGSSRASGGGGGGGGGAVQIVANTIINNAGAAIEARGGNGGLGGQSTGTGSSCARGGAGGGGSGGTINLQYMSSYTNSGTVSVAGGAGGASNGPCNSRTGGAGGNGGNGRTLFEQDIVLCTAPTTQASSFSFSNVTTTSADITFNRGNGDGGVLVVARAAAAPQSPTGGTSYTANSVFGSGSTTAAGSYVVYNSNAAGPVTFNVSGLTPGTSYQFSVHEWNTTATCYLNPGLAGTVPIPVCLPPNTQASAFLVTPSTNSANMSWTSGNGTAGELVVLRQGAAVSGDPVQTTSYTPNLAFGSGTALGSGFVVKAGTGGTANVTNLLPNTIYHYAIYTYNTSGPCYQTPALIGSFSTSDGPMTYSPSTVTQSSIASMTLGAASQQIVQLQLNTGPGTLPPLTLTSLNFNTNGSTLGATVGNDISVARIFWNSTNTLTGAVQFGTNITSFPGGSTAITVAGSQILQPNSNNYFFVVYDVSIGATTGNVLDGEITSITYTDGVTPVTVAPSPTTAPAGTRTITSLMSVTCGYTFSNFAATWTSNVGQAGTTVVATGAASINDQRWPSQSFTPGFTFEYNGTIYSSFGIASKGYIWFGSATPSGISAIPISTGATAFEGAIAAFAFDMVAHTASTTTPQVSVRYTGTAPNRVCTIEWTAFMPFGNTGGLCSFFGNPTDWNRYDIQLQLNENGGTNSNRIDIVLRDMNGFCVNANGTTSAQVGLRGSSNTDFLNRSGSGNTGHTASAAGTLNTSVISHGSNNFFNGNGGLRFTPTFAKPIITPSPTAVNVCPVEDVALSTTSPVVIKQWFNNNLAISGATAASYAAIASGNHLVMVTQGACSKLSTTTAVTITPCSAGTITTTNVAAINCAGAPISVSYTATGTFTAGNVFTAQLSDATGDFSSPVTIGTLTSTASGTIIANPGIIPALTTPGLGYKIRVISSTPSVTGTETASFEVAEPAPIISVTNPAAACAPATVDISATGVVTVTNGTTVSGITYWNNIGATIPYTGNPNAVAVPGTIYVRYANSCGNDVEPIVVTFSNPLITSNSRTNPTTCAVSNGTITLNGLLPSTSYAVVYQRNGPPNVSAGTISTNGIGALTITGLSDGAYDNIIVTQAGCASVAAYPASGFISLNDPAAPAVSSTSVVNPTTCLGNNGSILLNGLTATTSYNVIYDRNTVNVVAGSITSNGSGTLTIPNLTDGNYDNIILTLAGCNSAPIPSSGVIDLQPPSSPTIASHTANNPVTCAGANGSILLNGLAASTSYTVAYLRNGSPISTGSIVSNGSGVLTIGSLTSGAYTSFVVTNASSCSSAAYPAVGNITLTDPAIPNITSFLAHDPTSCVVNNGDIQLGGLLNATSYNLVYKRNGGANINAGSITTNGAGVLTLGGLALGDYDNIVVTLAGCASDPYPVSGSITLFNPPTPADAVGIPAEVCGADIVLLGATGAVAGEDYNWYNALTGGTLEQAGGSAFGTPFIFSTTNYFVAIVNNISGCESATRTQVTATIFPTPAPPIITPSGSTAICSGSTINLVSSYAFGNLWSNLSSTQSIPVTTAGSFTVTHTNVNGCSATSGVTTTTSIPSPQGTLSANGPICNSGNGELTFTATSGVAPFSLTYNNGSTNVTESVVNSGTPFLVNPNPVNLTTNYTLISVSDAVCTRSTAFTGPAASITVSPALLAPTFTTFNYNTGTSVDLSWVASATATSYFLEYGTSNTFASTIFSGDIGNVLTYPVTGLVAGNIYYYRVRAVNAICGNSPWSDVTPFLTTAIVWEGTVSTDWNVPQNWSPFLVPTISTDIEIFDRTNDPIIPTAGLNGFARNVSLQPNANLQIQTGKSLNVKGDWDAVGNSISGAGQVVFNGTVAQTITGNASFQNLTVDKTSGTIAITSGIQSITGIYRPTNGTLTTNGNLRLVSNASTTGIVSGNGAGSISGNVQVNRYMPGPGGYRYVSSPIQESTGLQIGDFDAPLSGADNLTWNPAPNTPIPSPFPNCWYYDETIQNPYAQFGWISETSGSIVTGRGYSMITPANHTASLTGPVNNGAISLPNFITRTPGFPAGLGVNLIGNPYPSPISWTAFRALNGTSNLSAVVKRFVSSGLYYGQYVDWNTAVGTPSSVGDNIALGQAFFVTKLIDGVSNIDYNNSIRVDNSSTTFYETQPVVNNLLRLQLIGGAGADEMVVYFDPTATNNYDVNYDAIKFLSETAGIPNIYTNIDTLKVSINVLEAFNQDMVIPMGIVAKTAGNYQVNVIDMSTFAPSSTVYLEDRNLGTYTNLRAVNQYNVNLPVGEHNGRFFIHFRPAVEVAVINETCQQNDGAVSITNPSAEQQWNVSLFDIAGQQLAQSTEANTTFANLNEGNYTLKITDASGYSVEQPFVIEAGQVVEANITPMSSNFFYTTDLIEASVEQVVSGMTYEWYLNGLLAGTGTEIALNVTEPGVYELMLKMSGATCIFQTSTSFSVTQESTVGIETAESASGFIIYPNPTRDMLNVQINQKIGFNKLSIFDASGRMVHSEVLNGALGQQTIQVNLNNLAAGLYQVTLEGNKKRSTAKFSKTK